MRQLFLVLLLLTNFGCSQSTASSFAGAFLGSSTPLIVMNSVNDVANSPVSAKAALALEEAVLARLIKRKGLALTKKNEQFIVNMKLIQYEELPHTPLELSLSVQLEILDVRMIPPQVILQEIISTQTLLETPIAETRLISLQDENFRISPLGLAHSKLSREIATRIEDYIQLARKG